MEVYERLKSKDMPSASYLYSSRRLFHLPHICHLADKDNFENSSLIQFLENLPLHTVYDFLKYIGVEKPENYEDKIIKAGFNSIYDSMLLSVNQEYNRVLLDKKIRLATYLADELSEYSCKQKEKLLKYFDKMGVLSSKNIAIVDIGWTGKTQLSLVNLLKDYDLNIGGYYLDLHQSAVERKNLININSYFKPFTNNTNGYTSIIETLTAANHGSVIEFDDNLNPIFDDDNDKAEIIFQIRAGMSKFIDEINSIDLEFDLQPSNDFIWKILERFLKTPSKEEALAFKEVKIIDGLAKLHTPLCRARFERFA
ncbi:MAG: hypothetical protein MZV70_69900 [Desulfobacterales bacterium]|nr:hypothetical protein [Desulfobacterales bacterium]